MKKMRFLLVLSLLLSMTATSVVAQNKIVVYRAAGVLPIEYVDTVYYRWNDTIGSLGGYEQIVVANDTMYTIPVESIDSMHYHGYVAHASGVLHTGYGTPAGGLLLMSYEDAIVLTDTVFDVDAFYTEGIQLLLVARVEDSLPLMLYRGRVDEDVTVHIDATSTALALVTMHPELVGAQNGQFDTLSVLISNASSFPELVRQVTLAVVAQRPLSDTTNVALIDALSAVVAELLSDNSGIVSANLLDDGPVRMTYEGNQLDVFTHSVVAIAPAYYGWLRNGEGQIIQRLHIPTHGDWGVISYLFDRLVNHNQNHAEGSHCVFNLNEGRYTFELSCINFDGFFDFAYHAIFLPIINQVSLIDVAGCIEPIFQSWVQNTGFSLFTSLVDAGDDNLDIRWVLQTLTQSAIEWIIPQAVDQMTAIIAGGGTSNCFRNVNVERLGVLTRIVPIMRVYGMGRDVANSALRIAGYVNAVFNYPEINRCVEFVENHGMEFCINANLELLSGDEQEGVGGDVLDNPVEVRVTMTDDYSPFTQLNHVYKLYVCLLSGEGSVNIDSISLPSYMFDFSEDGSRYYDASIQWTLGINDEHQQLGIVLKDLETGFLMTDTLKIDAYQLRPMLVADMGDNQNGNPGRLLSQLIRVRLMSPATENSQSEPLPNHTVQFIPAEGSGSVVYSTRTTDEDGYVSNLWRLGDHQTAQQLKMVAMYSGSSNDMPCSDTLYYDATMVPFHVEATMGDNQFGIGGYPLPLPIYAYVSPVAPSNGVDEDLNNPYTLKLWTDQGCGFLDDNIVTTNTLGSAYTYWTLGTDVTVQHAYATVLPSATATYSISDTVTFTATLLQPLLVCTSGDNQWGDIDSTLADTIEVTFFSTPNPDDPTRTGIADMLVHLWTQDSCGTVSDTLLRTDTNGVVRATWTLGQRHGNQTMMAQVVADSNATTTLCDAITIIAHTRHARLVQVSGQDQTYTASTEWLSNPLVFQVQSFVDDVMPTHTVNYPVEVWIESGNGLLATESGSESTFITAIITPLSEGKDSVYWKIVDVDAENIVGCQILEPHTLQPMGEPVFFNSSMEQVTYYFSVSSTMHAIMAPGNLQYKPATDTWRFAEQQYDYIGTSNLNLTNNDNTYNNWIDVFSWSTAYMPTYVPTNNSMYNYGFDEFFDWGNHPISNGGDSSFMWHTPTFAQWYYIINSRVNADCLKAYATMAGVHGMILLPDNWTLPTGSSFSPATYNWTTNVYTADEWSAMDLSGAAFLPAAGFRGQQTASSYTLTIVNEQNAGYYWSATGYKNYPLIWH